MMHGEKTLSRSDVQEISQRLITVFVRAHTAPSLTISCR